MSNYTKSTNFATKDNLTPGDPLKVVRGTEIDTEYNNIATAIATKTDNSAAAITGGSITGITDLAIADGGTGASTATAAINNLLPAQTSAANKYLQSDGTNVSWDAVTLSTADITGTLPVANGGTGVTSSTGTGNVVLSNSPTLVTPALGTPASGVATNITGLPISTGVSGLGTGVATFLGTPSSANLISAVTDETGTGSLVFATSPTLVTPALGTPSALVGTNITGTASGLTAGNVTTNANLTGAVTSVGNATSLGSFSSANLLGALTDETGTGSAVFATSPTLVTPILGTPTSATLTNATGLPIATGVSGLGTGVATFLATPSSANLAAALTDETGSGSAVFATSPTLVTPALGTPSSGVVTNLTGTASININGTVGATTATTGAFTTLSATGVTTLQAGTAALPALTTTGDTNTGIFFPTADTIAFSEGGAESMRITSAGDVGIGTTSPTARLELSGSGAQNLIVNSTSATSYMQFANSGGVTGYIGSSSAFITSGGANALGFRSTNEMVFSTGGSTERMRIDTSGNLGIGTSSPVAKLDVSKTSVDTVSRTSAVAALGDFATRNGLLMQQSLTSPYGFNLQVADAANSTQYPLLLNASGGSVGIGTNVPAVKLDISLSGGPTIRLTNSAPSSTTGDLIGALDYYSADVDNPAVRSYIRSYFQDTFGRDSYLTFGTTTTGGNALERMKIDNVGNVGIGTSSPSPSAKLTLSGTNTTSSILIYNNSQTANTALIGTVSALLGTGTNNDLAIGVYGSQNMAFYTGGTSEKGRFSSDGTFRVKGAGTAGSTDAVQFSGSAPATSLILDSAGGLKTLNTIGVGAATPSTSGAGITFPATDSPSSDANTLDDYEEGTFTPVVTSTSGGVATYTLQLGYYTKIGNCVSFTINVSWTAHTGAGDFSLLTGLPFTSKNVTNLSTTASIIANNITLTALNYPACFITSNSTSIALRQLSTGGSSTAVIPLDTSGNFFIAGHYFV